MNNSSRAAAAVIAVSSMLLAAGCSLPSGAGIDYSSAESPSAPAGAPALISMTVTKSWPMAGADRVQALDTLPDGRLLAIAAPDVRNGVAGELLTVDPAAESDSDPSTALHPIAYGSEYADAQSASIQVARGWAVAVGPEGRTAVSAGNRYGVVVDLERSPDEPGNYVGLITDQPASPITPVTGACWFPGVGEAAAGTLTVDGSNTIERRLASATGPGDGRPARVVMQEGPHLGVREGQQLIADQTGPTARPQLAPAQTLLVGGLSDLVCLDTGQVEQLHDVGITDGLRPGRGTAVLAVVNRELADGWYEGGTKLVAQSGDRNLPAGTHSTGALVGEATGSGSDRLDAVAIDAGTGVAVAGFQVRGDDVADNAQITGLTLDRTDARRGWVTIAGKDRLYEFVIDVT